MDTKPEVTSDLAAASKKGFFTKERLVIAAVIVFGGGHLIDDDLRSLIIKGQKELIAAQATQIQLLQLENQLLKEANGASDGTPDKDFPGLPDLKDQDRDGVTPLQSKSGTMLIRAAPPKPAVRGMKL